ncbi:glycosyltransferase [Aestuariimicrobium sp. p3-SID1156]|uniref:glycosyltransferase n=1 Tax=Aestuariimicrobium sp. p3-SID1156 TaxID=2916038 RepID=UPI00223C3727|nr:glycosyltransferase [Aestuariimicrobium sp. p3-SID1156]MCT1459210.1 glycosyltransferase [Aestuariimicrobium sp. p3-SID1156]
MKCCLVALGSRGDVAPFVAIGARLAAAGHQVRLVVLADYAHLAEGTGMVVHPASAGSSRALWPENSWLRRAALAQPGIMYLMMRRNLSVTAAALADAVVEASEACEVIVAGTASRRMVRRLAAARGSAMVTVLMAPLRPSTRADQSVLAPRLAPPAAAWLVSTVMWRLTSGLGAGPDQAIRSRLSHSRQRTNRHRDLVESLVCATSTTLSAGAADAGWIDTGPVTPQPLDAGLASFLDNHPDAVLMGFGSCPSPDPQADVSLFRRAARRVGRPLVLQTPLLPTGRVDEVTWNAPGTDHRQLLGRVAAVVHHGGAGTTLTTLASGTPAVVVPHLGDQAWHARRVAELGVGISAPPRWRLTCRALTACLKRALEEPIPDTASRLAPVIAAEAGGADQLAEIIIEASHTRPGAPDTEGAGS